MLTATYTLVALSVEQANVRLSLLSFQKYVQSTLLRQQRLTLSQLEYACETLERLYQACHWRKIDMFLIPAIRRATPQADGLLSELDALSNAAGEAIADIVAMVSAGPIDNSASVGRFCGHIEAFCDAMLIRLEREEAELFSLARTMITGEEWFDVANQMLAHDAYRQETRPARDAAAYPAEPAAIAGAMRLPEGRHAASLAG